MSDAVPVLPFVSAEVQTRIEQFLYYEAELLDERNFREWLQLFTEDIGLLHGHLQLFNWLIGHTDDQADCPMCGSHTASARTKLKVLLVRLQEVEDEAGVEKEVSALL